MSVNVNFRVRLHNAPRYGEEQRLWLSPYALSRLGRKGASGDE